MKKLFSKFLIPFLSFLIKFISYLIREKDGINQSLVYNNKHAVWIYLGEEDGTRILTVALKKDITATLNSSIDAKGEEKDGIKEFKI